MNWIFVLIGLAIIAIASIIVRFACSYWISYSWEDALDLIAVISICILVISGAIISGFAFIAVPRDIEIFERQKAYIESHVADNQIEDAALTTKKIELNEWLYNAQYCKNKYGNWSLFPDSVQTLTPIE